jgi:hypothetical protein
MAFATSWLVALSSAARMRTCSPTLTLVASPSVASVASLAALLAVALGFGETGGDRRRQRAAHGGEAARDQRAAGLLGLPQRHDGQHMGAGIDRDARAGRRCGGDRLDQFVRRDAAAGVHRVRRTHTAESPRGC